MRKLPDDHKLKIVRLVPDSHANYPAVYMNGCNRRFKVQWLESHPWLHYSPSENGAYCRACALFAPEEVRGQQLGVLVTEPFRTWTKQSSVFERHEKREYHHIAVVRMQEFVKACDVPSRNIANRLSKEREEQLHHNTEVIKSLFECIIFCGIQAISLRGHRDDATSSANNNRGNFIELVEFRAKTDEILSTHLKKAPMNATYTSKTIQNELISVIGDTIRGGIINEIKDAQFFTILADEVTDCSNLEQLSIAIRFVDKNEEVREEFLDFITVERITGAALATAILTRLESWGIDIKNCRGQGYDGASNMSSSRAGVQGRISEVAPLAFYTHCSAHQLNLCIVSGCSIPQVRNASGTISEIAKFFNYSPKRQHFFEKIIDSSADSSNITKLKDLCKTRWIQRIDSYSTFFQLYPFVVQTMEAIVTRNSEYGEWLWDSETITKANGFLRQMATFEFIVSSSVTMRLLSSLRPVTVKLQKRSTDILKAYELTDVQLYLELLSTNCEEFHSWFEEIVQFSESLNVDVSVPRIVGRQIYRGNIPGDSPEAYYRRNIMVPFLDHILDEMRDRFGGIHQQIVKLLGLIPSIIATCNPTLSIEEVATLYKTDLPSPPLVSTEYRRWKGKWISQPPKDRPDSLQKALAHCDIDSFPNIRVLLLIACTLPVTVCENERSNSQIKLLKTYLRSTMNEDRMSALAIMKIHRQKAKELDLNCLVHDFANRHPRRMLLPCVLPD